MSAIIKQTAETTAKTTATTTIYTWDLSNRKFGIIELADPAFGKRNPIATLDDLPESGSIVVYIVGHAVPNGLRDQTGNIVPEKTIAERLARRTGNTLVMFDICFAEAFEKIDDFKWPDRIGRIYSCREYERTWHNGDTLPPPRQSLFSRELNRALPACIASDSFSDLEASLIAAFGGLQRPRIVVKPPLRPSTFF